jgi:hypothetical protein
MELEILIFQGNVDLEMLGCELHMYMGMYIHIIDDITQLCQTSVFSVSTGVWGPE